MMITQNYSDVHNDLGKQVLALNKNLNNVFKLLVCACSYYACVLKQVSTIDNKNTQARIIKLLAIS